MIGSAGSAVDGDATGPATALDGKALVVSGLYKRFGANEVLRGVDLTIGEGEICALLGLNGSGKSTLIKILSGFHKADSGQVWVGDAELNAGMRQHVGPSRIRFVHQDLGLAAGLSAADNMALGAGYPRTKCGTISWRRTREAAQHSLHALGYEFDPRLTIGQLSAVERAGTAIARAMRGADGSARLLVLDEPTAALPVHECERLFGAVRRLAARGTAVLYVTHHLDEVFELAHRVCVLRDGQMVDNAAVRDRTHDLLIEQMSGRTVVRADAAASAAPTGVPALRVTGLTTTRLRDVDLTASVGEVVGIAGLTGSGRDEMAPALMGTRPRRGQLTVGEQVVPAMRPDRSVAAGMACLPANRVDDAVLPTMSVKHNLTITGLKGTRRRLLVNRGAEGRRAATLIDRLSVHPRLPDQPVMTLSGGNQQKVVLGRWLGVDPLLMVLDEPTQGVDVTTRATVYQELREASRRSAVLVCSSDSDELAEVCDRVLVVRAGRLVAELHAPIDPAEVEAIALGADDRRETS